MKQHPDRVQDQISSCGIVSHDICHQMLEFQENKQSEELDETNGYEGEVQQSPPCLNMIHSAAQNKRKRKANVEINGYSSSRGSPGSQPTLRSVFSSEEAKHKAKMAIVRWLFEAHIPFSAIQSPYFQPALDAIAAVGSGFKVPSYYELRGNLLRDCKKECQLLVESHRANWAESGCTIMVDCWSDQKQRTLINFLVYCPTSITFVKSVDASNIVQDAGKLCNLFSEVIEWVGPNNVVHVVTDNAAIYVDAGKLIREKYDTIFWSPCASRCMNLLLKDICSMSHVVDLASKASKVTAFLYNHMIFLSWLRKREGWREIVCPGADQFDTTFITLKNMHDHKIDLQALAVDKHFTSHRLARTATGKVVSAIILDNEFWDDCLFLVKIVGPLIRLLRIVNADEKPSLGYVYEGMQRAKISIKEMFMNKRYMYKPYTNILKARWDKHFKHNLHAAAYLLNPAFRYDEKFRGKNRVMKALLDLFRIKSFRGSLFEVIDEILLYYNREGDFSQESAYCMAKTVQPDQWWRLYGGSVPTLQKLAIHLLSQTSSRCERNWSFFECIHTKRSKIEHQRLSDHVYVAYNLRLKNRWQYKKRCYDPIDYEFIDRLDFWVIEEEAPRV